MLSFDFKRYSLNDEPDWQLILTNTPTREVFVNRFYCVESLGYCAIRRSNFIPIYN